jgi:hypothetical protein
VPATTSEAPVSNTTLATQSQRQPAEHKAEPALKITRKVRDAITAMVWEGLPRADAATKAGISEHGLYKALRKPPVKAYYLRELEVLRTSERARNFHTLCEVRDQRDNQMARVNAVKALEQVDEISERASSIRSPGVVIQIVNQGPNDPKPLITLDHVPNTRSERDGDGS